MLVTHFLKLIKGITLTYANRAQFDDGADTKIRFTHKSKVFDPFLPVTNINDHIDVVRTMVWIIGRYFVKPGEILTNLAF